VDNRQIPREREDSWARRCLMHNFNQTRGVNPWPDQDANGNNYQRRPRFNDVGYGNINRGCLVTLKDIPHWGRDAECTRARQTVLGRTGPY
jgi:hypothetical protein